MDELFPPLPAAEWHEMDRLLKRICEFMPAVRPHGAIRLAHPHQARTLCEMLKGATQLMSELRELDAAAEKRRAEQLAERERDHALLARRMKRRMGELEKR